MEGKLTTIVIYKEITREEDYEKARRHHCPWVKGGERENCQCCLKILLCNSKDLI